MAAQRITLTLPSEVVTAIDRTTHDRDSFVTDAVRHEIDRRKEAQLRRSLDGPHPETSELAVSPSSNWPAGVPRDEWDDLLTSDLGEEIRWEEGKGWQRQIAAAWCS